MNPTDLLERYENKYRGPPSYFCHWKTFHLQVFLASGAYQYRMSAIWGEGRLRILPYDDDTHIITLSPGQLYLINRLCDFYSLGDADGFFIPRRFLPENPKIEYVVQYPLSLPDQCLLSLYDNKNELDEQQVLEAVPFSLHEAVKDIFK